MKYDSKLKAIVDELGCIAVANVPADVGDIIDGWRKEIDKLHDALERQSELIAALRVEIATKAKRIDKLEQTVLHLTAQCQECVEQLQSDGKTYSEGCKP